MGNSAEGSSTQAEKAPSTKAAPQGGSRFEAGRGLDVGTANLPSAIQDKDGNVIIKIQRNAFIDIDADHYTRNMLTKLNVQHVSINGNIDVGSDAAVELANIFIRVTRRRMNRGVI